MSTSRPSSVYTHNQLRPSCCGLWNGLELGGFRSYAFIYIGVRVRLLGRIPSPERNSQ